MAKVDLAFALLAQQPIPADHGYVLYGALSRTVPLLHSSDGIGVHPIRGQQIGDRRLSVTSQSRLVLRVDTENISAVLPLAGNQLDVAGARLRVGVPQILSLQPSTALRSRLATTDPARTNRGLKRKCTDDWGRFNYHSKPFSPLVNPHPTRPRQEMYKLIVDHADESLALQTHSLATAP